MSRHAAIELKWGDGAYTFRLGLSELEELERKLDLGIFQIVMRLSPETRVAKSREILEVIRLGLIGGGLQPVEAMVKAEQYVDRRPLDENRDVAYAIALASLMRLHSTEVEKAPEAPQSGETEAVKKRKSTSPPSKDLP
jgi:hypothetical protein